MAALAEDAVGKLRTYGMPFFREVAEKHGVVLPESET
jgi:hypothetical protein